MSRLFCSTLNYKNGLRMTPVSYTHLDVYKRQVMSTTTDKMTDALAALSHAPKLIVTDSQVFGYVYELSLIHI